MQDDSNLVGKVDPEPEILLQPETKPISYEQLLVEIKRIYAGLVKVEARCIDLDQMQCLATQGKDPRQWEVPSNLHQTLLHKHHDFLLLDDNDHYYAHPSGPCQYKSTTWDELIQWEHSLKMAEWEC